MHDDLKNTTKGEDEHINIILQDEINYWTKELNVSSIGLVYAVTAVGPMVKDVRKWLSENDFNYLSTSINPTTTIVNNQFFLFPAQDQGTF